MTQLIIGERFKILDLESNLLGRGGMGSVYLGEDIQTGQKVAIKMLLPDIKASDWEIVARFVAEGELLSQLNHPNIVKMIDMVSEGDLYYLVMEYVSGRSLRHLLDQKQTLSVEMVLNIALDLTDALIQTHKKGAIHRDIKPGNVLLDEFGVPRLADFGIARLVGRSGFTATGALLMTMDYGSPESFDGAPPDEFLDLWAFGVMLYEMLAGQRPFRSDTIFGIIRVIKNDQPPDLLTLRPDIPPTLNALIMRMLAKERKNRIQSARQLGVELETILKGRNLDVYVPVPASVPPLNPPSPPPLVQINAAELPTERRNLLILLEKVRTAWIEGVLDVQTMDYGFIPLIRRPYNEAVERPWDKVKGTVAQRSQTEKAEQSILDTFRAANNVLLIVGSPGAGKTTTLLQLAKELIVVAEREPEQPIPTVLHLLSWVEQQEPIAQWVIKELNSKYQIPPKIGQEWLEDNQLILLLDGLDELPSIYQNNCVKALNDFRETHAFVGIAICSRDQEYATVATTAPLHLGGATRLQSLTLSQINAYLANAGEVFSTLSQNLKEDPALQRMAQSPLALSIIISVYTSSANSTPFQLNELSDVVPTTSGVNRQKLLKTYVEYMLEKREGHQLYSDDQTKKYLAWLAQKMTQHNQSVFLSEQMQPNWLATKGQRYLYLLITRLVAGGFVTAMMVLLSLFLDHSVQIIQKSHHIAGLPLSFFVPFNLLFFLNMGLGALVSVVDFIFAEYAYQLDNISTLKIRIHLLHLIAISFVVAFTSLLTFYLLFQGVFLFVYIIFQTYFLTYTLNFFALHRISGYFNEISMNETVHWSWADANAGFLGAIISSLVGTGAFLLVDVYWGILSLVASFISLYCLSGLIRQKLEKKEKSSHIFWQVFKNGVFAGLIASFPLLLWFGLAWSIFSGYLVGLLVFLLYFIPFGGFDVVKYATLRLLLQGSGSIPKNYRAFLDYAARRVFLRKVGDGYIFMHRSLQEYFASMNNKVTH